MVCDLERVCAVLGRGVRQVVVWLKSGAYAAVNGLEVADELNRGVIKVREEAGH